MVSSVTKKNPSTTKGKPSSRAKNAKRAAPPLLKVGADGTDRCPGVARALEVFVGSAVILIEGRHLFYLQSWLLAAAAVL